MIIDVLNDVEVLQCRFLLDRQLVSVQLGQVDVVVGSYEVFVVFSLSQKRDFFLNRRVQFLYLLVMGVVDVLRITGTEPKPVVTVYAGMGKGQSSCRLKAVCKIHHQIVFVLIAVVLEDVSVFPDDPNVSGTIHLKMAEVGRLLDESVPVRQRVMGKLLAVVTVYSFMGQKPHVSFGILFDGDDSSAAETLVDL